MNRVTTWDRASRLPSVLVKAAMALSGAGMAVWLTLHMAGHLLWLLGPTTMNSYGAQLHGSGVLWPIRLLLLGGFGVHVAAAWLTSRRAHAARRVPYRELRPAASSVASRSMRWTGVMLLVFVLYHVATVYGVLGPAPVPGAFHQNLTAMLLRPIDALLLSAAAGLVALHLGHGLASACVSLGLIAKQHEGWLRRWLRRWALMVTVGFLLPLAACWLQHLGPVPIFSGHAVCVDFSSGRKAA